MKHIQDFMQVKRLEEGLKDIRDHQGYPPVFRIDGSGGSEGGSGGEGLQKTGFTYSDVIKMQEDGLNIVFMFSHTD